LASFWGVLGLIHKSLGTLVPCETAWEGQTHTVYPSLASTLGVYIPFPSVGNHRERIADQNPPFTDKVGASEAPAVRYGSND